MMYPLIGELPDLIERKLVTKRKHPNLPLWIHNYSAACQSLPIAEWTATLCDCRGLILDENGEIVGRPFRKFWNYEQVCAQIPAGEAFNIWEKWDGSLGIVCFYAGERIVATRGSFESDQAKWFADYLNRTNRLFYEPGVTHLFEIVYPANRIVVDYGGMEDAVLLGVLGDDGVDLWPAFESVRRFRKAARLDGIADFSAIDSDPRFAGQEGFVVQWESGFRAKVKLLEYKRLHRLITQCSTRTIWELLRAGGDTTELLERVPADFKSWAEGQISGLSGGHRSILDDAAELMRSAPSREPRKDFAMWAKGTPYPGLLFSLLDGKDIADAAWKLVEPKWSTPFKGEAAE